MVDEESEREFAVESSSLLEIKNNNYYQTNVNEYAQINKVK